jgi:hypothetical protein
MTASDNPSFASTQAVIVAGLTGSVEGVPRELASGYCAAPLKRFNVHRNTVLSALTDALRSRYPVVERLVGEAFFRAVAREFAADHPPRSPALLEYGQGFADFLSRFQPARPLPYLPDVARLEWLHHAAYHAADAEPMSPAALAAVPAEALCGVMLQLHPSAGLIASDYPVLSIWATNIRDREVRRLGAEMEGEAVLVLRPRLEVVLVRLEQGGAAFIDAIGRGAGLAAATARAAECAPAFSLPETLGSCLAAGAFAGFSLEGENNDEVTL